MPRSIFDLLESHVQTRPDQPAVRFKRDDRWQDLSWREIRDRANAVSAAMVQHGITAGERVAILSNTRFEWSVTDLGILGARAVTVPIYQSNTPDEASYILEDSGAVWVFAEDAEQMAKLREVRDRVPHVRGVVCFDASAIETGPDGWETGWDDFLAEGRRALEGDVTAELERRRAEVEPGDLATLIYTSGTTGRPKGVQATQDNLLTAAQAVVEIEIMTPDDVQLLFLPLAHSFAKLLQVGWLATGSVLAYAESIDKLVDNMSEVRPTLIASVPRIFEKVHARVVGTATSQPGLKGKLARWAFAKGEEAALAAGRGESHGGLGWTLARLLVFKKAGQRLVQLFGGRLGFFVSGGAPLSPEIAYFFKYAGVQICEGYGLTETSSISTFNRPGKVKIGTVGPAMPSVELRLAADGEVLQRGRTVFTGYWKRPEETREVLSEDGWFSTGDIGEIDADGYLSITDRKKDLIVTAGGKNVAPQHVENLLKSRSPLISQVVAYGDRRPYLVALVTLDQAALESWAAERGLEGSHAELTRRDEVRAEVEREVAAVNRQLPSYETLKTFDLLDHDFEIGDQLTPTLKVRRKLVNQRYAELFDRMYRQGETSAA